jgi:DNA polymerase-4
VFLQQHFGSSADWYFAIARGEDHRPVNPNRVRKSSGSETTFRQDLVASDDIEAGIVRMAEEVWAWCEKRQAFGRTATVKVKYADFQQITRRRSRPSAITSFVELREAALDLIRLILPTEKPIRLVGVTVSTFEDAPPKPAPQLFADDLQADLEAAD